uniref:prealbumin-like fold domain-containing protein n=1 Tax=Serratia marcescens TaxID=615 RepID=UPI00165332F6
DFETRGEAIDITGKLIVGKTYYLHEVTAPSGYLLSADIAFTVPKKTDPLEITMTDPKKPNPGSNKMYLQKVDSVTNQGIEGVEFTIYSSNNAKYEVVTTGADGYAKLDIPPDGTYTYKETKVAPGYLKTDQTYS